MDLTPKDDEIDLIYYNPIKIKRIKSYEKNLPMMKRTSSCIIKVISFKDCPSTLSVLLADTNSIIGLCGREIFTTARPTCLFVLIVSRLFNVRVPHYRICNKT